MDSVTPKRLLLEPKGDILLPPSVLVLDTPLWEGASPDRNVLYPPLRACFVAPDVLLLFAMVYRCPSGSPTRVPASEDFLSLVQYLYSPSPSICSCHYMHHTVSYDLCAPALPPFRCLHSDTLCFSTPSLLPRILSLLPVSWSPRHINSMVLLSEARYAPPVSATWSIHIPKVHLVFLPGQAPFVPPVS